jgi:hypothetical protein
MKIKVFVIIMILSGLLGHHTFENTFANGTFIIASEKAGGYQYSMMKEENTFIWKIGHQENLLVIKENKENEEKLERFIYSVEEINSHMFELMISASYFMIVMISTLIVIMKNKQTLRGGYLLIITALAGIALYNSIVTSIDLTAAFEDAGYYYSMLVTIESNH